MTFPWRGAGTSDFLCGNLSRSTDGASRNLDRVEIK